MNQIKIGLLVMLAIMSGISFAGPYVFLVSPATETTTANSIEKFDFLVTDDVGTKVDCYLFMNGIHISTTEVSNPVGLNSLTLGTMNGMVPIGTNHWYVACTDRAGNFGRSRAFGNDIAYTITRS
ncbi:hypothetical protein HZC07_02940 [Candidatus Micrarchaeota archaeon]|nr:hypothetical protein [Candidatus Micrarchaeota archaeon]